jgi:hypothetical protein
LLRLILLACLCSTLDAHDLITTKITWTREISRLMFDKCTSCHREGGTAFSLTTYEQARPWAKAIKEEVLERRMPPFGAVKGFADLLGDQALMQEQIELISAWVEGGAPEGDPVLLPKDPDVNPTRTTVPIVGAEFVVKGTEALPRAMTFAGIKPKTLAENASVRVVAQAPDGAVTPLLWIYQFREKFAQSYYFRKPLAFPAGTKIISFPKDAGSIALLTSAGSATASASLLVKPR